ncbi:MAG: hypothetical protein ACXW50_01405 [Candidatus Binatia bacterium]
MIATLGSGCRSIAPLLPSVSPPAEDEEVRISREFRREAKSISSFSISRKSNAMSIASPGEFSAPPVRCPLTIAFLSSKTSS